MKITHNKQRFKNNTSNMKNIANVAERSSATSYLVSMNSDYLVNNLLTELRRCDMLIISCKILLHMGRTYSIQHIVLCIVFIPFHCPFLSNNQQCLRRKKKEKEAVSFFIFPIPRKQ